jgi:hypothetical protein
VQIIGCNIGIIGIVQITEVVPPVNPSSSAFIVGCMGFAMGIGCCNKVNQLEGKSSRRGSVPVFFLAVEPTPLGLFR